MVQQIANTHNLSEPPNGNQEHAELAERTSQRNVIRPAIDIVETSESILIVADMSGVDESSAEVKLEDNLLTICGRVEIDRPEGYTAAYAAYEPYDYERAFTVTDAIDRNGIEATVKNGVMRLTLPKAKEKLAKKIAVTSG